MNARENEEIRSRLIALDRSHSAQPEERSLWRLIRSIHSAPGLRDLTTLQSRALYPWVTPGRQPGETRLYVALAIDARSSPGRLANPWGYVAWSWPSQRLLTWGDAQGSLAEFSGIELRSDRHLCTRARAEAIERSLTAGTSPPTAPRPIPELIRHLLLACLPGESPESESERDPPTREQRRCG